jgi:hypothetical protein
MQAKAHMACNGMDPWWKQEFPLALHARNTKHVA